MADVPLRAARPQYCALSNEKLASIGIVMPTWQDAVASVRRYVTSGFQVWSSWTFKTLIRTAGMFDLLCAIAVLRVAIAAGARILPRHALERPAPDYDRHQQAAQKKNQPADQTGWGERELHSRRCSRRHAHEGQLCR